MDGLSAFLGAAALFIVIVVGVLSYSAGARVVADRCILAGNFVFNDKVYTCQERKP